MWGLSDICWEPEVVEGHSKPETRRVFCEGQEVGDWRGQAQATALSGQVEHGG